MMNKITESRKQRATKLDSTKLTGEGGGQGCLPNPWETARA
jgi:hypothetical protein